MEGTPLIPEAFDVAALLDLVKEILMKIVDLFTIFPFNIFFTVSLVGIGFMFFRKLRRAA